MRTSFLIPAVFTCLVVFISPLHASYTVNIEAAREYIAKKQYQEAVALLREAVREAPEQAEGHFLLAVATMWSGDCDSACTIFTGALERDPSLVPRMSEQVKQRIYERIAAGDIDGARSAITIAVKYDPELRREIAQSCLHRGVSYIDSGDSAKAEDLFQFVADVDPPLKSNICELLYKKARAATGEESLKLVVASLRYGDRYQKETARMVLRLANDLEDERSRRGYLKQAEGYIEPERLLNASVEYYTRAWGPPGKMNLASSDVWIAVDKARREDRVRYLTGDRVLTRGDEGPRELPVSVIIAAEYEGVTTASERDYTRKLWFAAAEAPATIYYWFLRGQ